MLLWLTKRMLVPFSYKELQELEQMKNADEWAGSALYIKESFFGNKKNQYRMKIVQFDDRTLLLLPKYGCVTELILHAKDENTFTCSEKLLDGDCTVDTDATTTLRFRDNEIDYIWKTDSESMTATLKKTK